VTERIVLAVPTYRRYDLCLRMLRSVWSGSLLPDRVLIVDNGGGFERYWEEHNVLLPGWDEVVVPGKNLGVAASWNRAIRWAKSTPVLIVNDDIVLDVHTLEAFAEAAVRDRPQILTVAPNMMWECFLQNQAMVDAVGEYDEGFWPAYFEDDDYRWRMRLLGLTFEAIDAGAVRHDTSSTIAVYSEAERAEHERTYAANSQRYARKWGGTPGLETRREAGSV
jgi:GT2 family glycosyltransferase